MSPAQPRPWPRPQPCHRLSRAGGTLGAAAGLPGRAQVPVPEGPWMPLPLDTWLLKPPTPGAPGRWGPSVPIGGPASVASRGCFLSQESIFLRRSDSPLLDENSGPSFRGNRDPPSGPGSEVQSHRGTVCSPDAPSRASQVTDPSPRGESEPGEPSPSPFLGFQLSAANTIFSGTF